MTRQLKLALVVSLASLTMGGMSDPAAEFAERMDTAPPDQRVPNWEHVKGLMARSAPEVGEDAPEFSLKTLGGKQTVQLSAFQGKQPVVLIFGSYT